MTDPSASSSPLPPPAPPTATETKTKTKTKRSWWKRRLLKLPVWAWITIGVVAIAVIGSMGSEGESSRNTSPSREKSAGATATADSTEGSSSPTETPATTTTEPPDGEPGTRDNPVPLGTAADVGNGWMMTVNSVDLDGNAAVAAANDFNEPAPDGMTYVVVNVTLTYDGDEESDSAGVGIAGLGAGTNKKVDILTSQHFVVPPEPQLDSMVEVFKGGTVEGNTVLEVPLEDVPTLLILGEAHFSFDRDARKFFSPS